MKVINNGNGFSLIELLIVIAIVGIIAAIAYPNYSASVAKSRRTDAQAGLMGLASAMERFYTINNTYKGAGDGGDTDKPPVASLYPAQTPLDGNAKFYNLTLSATTITYVLKATPIHGQVGDHCGNLTLTHTGVKGAAESDCWR